MAHGLKAEAEKEAAMSDLPVDRGESIVYLGMGR